MDMRIQGILTRRVIEHEQYMDIVHEWEDELAKTLSVPLIPDFDFSNRIISAIRGRVPWFARWLKPHVNSLVFEMWAMNRDRGNNKSTIVPVQVDFWLRDENKIRQFKNARDRNRVALITSAEVCEVLAGVCVWGGGGFRHWAMSLPDKWFDPEFNHVKKYEFAIFGRVGRKNSRWGEWLSKYAEANPTFSYYYSDRVDGKFCLCDKMGNPTAPLGTREEYMEAVKSTRITLYSTPSQDSDNAYTNGYNQVTPRFLEFIAGGCHVLSRYPKNADTDYYEMPMISPCVETYADFASKMDYARAHEIDRVKYSAYLKKHLTSVRARELEKILTEY